MLIWCYAPVSDLKACLCSNEVYSPDCNPQHAEPECDGGALCLQGEPGPVGEDISGRGGGHHAQPALWFRPCQGGQLTTKGVAGSPKEYNLNPAADLVLCRGKDPHPVSAGDGSAKGDLTLKTHSYLIGWRRCQHWRFHRSQRLTDSWWGGTSTHHPTSTQLGNSLGRMDLRHCGCFTLAVLCYFMFFFYLSWFFYGLVFAEALLWTFHRLQYVKSCCRFRLFLKKWYCLPSVVGLSYAHYFSKVFPETEGMCRADIWCDATLLRWWMSECFFLITFWAKILCSTWIKTYSLFEVEMAETPRSIFSTKPWWTVARGVR